MNSTNIVLFFVLFFFQKLQIEKKNPRLWMNVLSIFTYVSIYSLINPLLANLCFPCNFVAKRLPRKGVCKLYTLNFVPKKALSQIHHYIVGFHQLHEP
jgi:hypothetical protein